MPASLRPAPGIGVEKKLVEHHIDSCRSFTATSRLLGRSALNMNKRLAIETAVAA
jgi:hypothetical protein